jgi:hypothetical protein
MLGEVGEGCVMFVFGDDEAERAGLRRKRQLARLGDAPCYLTLGVEKYLLCRRRIGYSPVLKLPRRTRIWVECVRSIRASRDASKI